MECFDGKGEVGITMTESDPRVIINEVDHI